MTPAVATRETNSGIRLIAALRILCSLTYLMLDFHEAASAILVCWLIRDSALLVCTRHAACFGPCIWACIVSLVLSLVSCLLSLVVLVVLVLSVPHLTITTPSYLLRVVNLNAIDVPLTVDC